MINSLQYSPSFQKKLVAKVNLPTQSGVENCSIYELDDAKKDARRLKKQIKKQDWQYKEEFLEPLRDKDNPMVKMLKIKLFSLEDEKKNCLGLLRTYNFAEIQNVDYIEVNPEYKSSNKDAKIKNIGSAMLSFFLKSNKNCDFIVLHPVTSAYGFYDKFGFDRQTSYQERDKYYLPEEKVAQTIANNEQKIGSKVEILG